MVRAPCFHCREHRFDPWSGNYIKSHMPCGAAKKIKNKVKKDLDRCLAKRVSNWILPSSQILNKRP